MSRIEAIVETAIYVDDLDAAEAFYRDVLGLEVIGKESGRHVFFRVGDGVLLAFGAEATLRGDKLPPHGSTGPPRWLPPRPGISRRLSGASPSDCWSECPGGKESLPGC